MPEEILIRHCAPTLAGLKTGSLVSCQYTSREEVIDGIRRLNGLLGKKGLCVLPLRFRKGRVLIYVYRPAQLQTDLESPAVRALLEEKGYCCECPARCLVELQSRLSGESFPHEIGLFLGYPPEDVTGFMENAACGYKCVGCWKVYGDEEKARSTFERFERCSRVYYDQWKKGKSIERLTVAV